MRATFALLCLAMSAFAANSLLARAALAGGAIDAAGFTAIRLISGAVCLIGLVRVQQGGDAVRARPGSWGSAFCLFVYAIAFSLAYLRLGAATGALILFGAVQASMIVLGLIARHRPSRPEMAGLVIALCAFVYLLLPGLQAPDPLGGLLMIAAGIAWGFYSVRGRGRADPLGETAGNFVRAAVIALPLVVLPHHISPGGAALALVCGVVTSGMGYAIWYRALPALSTLQAATVQLTVPILAAMGAVAILSEPLSWRLVLCGLLILGGVAVSFAARSRTVPAM